MKAQEWEKNKQGGWGNKEMERAVKSKTHTVVTQRENIKKKKETDNASTRIGVKKESQGGSGRSDTEEEVSKGGSVGEDRGAFLMVLLRASS